MLGGIPILKGSQALEVLDAFLRDTFGDAYDAYAARVPSFLPNPKLFHDPKTLTILPERLYGTLRDGLIFFLAMPAFELVEYVQDLGLLPTLFRLY